MLSYRCCIYRLYRIYYKHKDEQEAAYGNEAFKYKDG